MRTSKAWACVVPRPPNGLVTEDPDGFVRKVKDAARTLRDKHPENECPLTRRARPRHPYSCKPGAEGNRNLINGKGAMLESGQKISKAIKRRKEETPRTATNR
ncbi:MAG TPA: hypothetical protein VFZ27_07605, partial [Terriglobia bacterium]|nr:hypothetical protein [Terriglobia bacterium]